MAEIIRAEAAGPDRQRGADIRLTMAMLAIVLAGAALRLHGIDRTSIWLDEAISWDEARRPFWGMIRATAGETSQPLHNIILYVVIRLFGDSAIALRLPSTVLGIANIYLLYRLGAVLWDRTTGVLAAALVAFSGFHLWYSQEARMYALFAVTATAFVLASVNFLRRPDRLRAVFCTTAGLALLYSHPYGLLVWIGVNTATAAVLFRDGDWIAARGRSWLATQALAGLGFLPWALLLQRQARRVMHGFWIAFPTPDFLYAMAVSIADGAAMLACLPILLLLSFLPDSASANPAREGSALRGFRRPAALPPLALDIGWQHIVLLSWLMVPFLIGYAVSVAARPILIDRYLIGSLPALMLLAARGLHVLCFNRLVLTGAGAALLASGIPMLHSDLTKKLREDDRAAVAVFAQNFRSSDLVVFLQPPMSIPFSYYFRLPIRPPVIVRNSEADDVDWPGANRIWLFVRQANAAQSAKLFERIEHLYFREEEFHFFRVAVYLYIRRPGGLDPPGRALDARPP
jgi:mannosyltransferase